MRNTLGRANRGLGDMRTAVKIALWVALGLTVTIVALVAFQMLPGNPPRFEVTIVNLTGAPIHGLRVGAGGLWKSPSTNIIAAGARRELHVYSANVDPLLLQDLNGNLYRLAPGRSRDVEVVVVRIQGQSPATGLSGSVRVGSDTKDLVAQ